MECVHNLNKGVVNRRLHSKSRVNHIDVSIPKGDLIDHGQVNPRLSKKVSRGRSTLTANSDEEGVAVKKTLTQAETLRRQLEAVREDLATNKDHTNRIACAAERLAVAIKLLAKPCENKSELT
jgi:hypothetical protein